MAVNISGETESQSLVEGPNQTTPLPAITSKSKNTKSHSNLAITVTTPDLVST